MGEALAYLAAGVTAAGGMAHVMPTGFTLVLLGVLVAVVTMRGGSADLVTQAVYAVAAVRCWCSRCGQRPPPLGVGSSSSRSVQW
jgi:hypothetical protein